MFGDFCLAKQMTFMIFDFLKFVEIFLDILHVIFIMKIKIEFSAIQIHP